VFHIYSQLESLGHSAPEAGQANHASSPPTTTGPIFIRIRIVTGSSMDGETKVVRENLRMLILFDENEYSTAAIDDIFEIILSDSLGLQ
jgi:hypothetical protein